MKRIFVVAFNVSERRKEREREILSRFRRYAESRRRVLDIQCHVTPLERDDDDDDDTMV